MSDAFEEVNRRRIKQMGLDSRFIELTKLWFEIASLHEYSYHFKWLGRPIIQFPQDVVAIQEIIWETRPDLIIETGVARGGSVILHASVLEAIGEDGQVLGIDIDIRSHNRVEIERHPLFSRIKLLEGSSISPEIINQVRAHAARARRCMVILDSNHTHAHVKRELEIYAPLVSPDCYLLVFDTIIEFMPESFSANRPWGPGNNPMTALEEFLKTDKRFEVQHDISAKLGITVAPGGYLKCIGDHN